MSRVKLSDFVSLSMNLSITLVRHGNTDANNEHWIQGQLGKMIFLIRCDTLTQILY